ncbi:SusC/RagA family TonB-linked outer membrane protein [Flavobacterium gilvum]|uniref:TonB-dependent receptor plug domain-containing protein n=1 Tax=Flavobacterium gilvum TaxID=1492737 RepID=A0AAC9I1X4_9FLAO|nr:TonB-dependent receptor [Flavobacterium gilvum]AOW08581.1 hypothetical protein EM308_03200 [Flavobacterium gilvum]KFC58428.1 hypothetical protein FEM08_27970 [Flavobacterium gilvum]
MKNLNLKHQPFTKVFRHFLVGVFIMMVSVFAQAQNKTVSGQVYDQNKVGLYGVTVTVKGTKTATSTDFDGKFKISASPSDQLVFSYIGFETRTLTVGSSSTMNISLTEANSKLNEVIVVGYGTKKKSNLTGSVSTVSAKAIENRPVANLATALQGQVPGMNVTRTSGQPGKESIGIQIRGATSANGAINPLLVVDGVPTDMFMLQTINPNDVESMSVLKDAAAASIYGAQAAGGVILVTTKKGKEGKTIFEASSNLGIEKPMFIPKRLSLLDEANYSNLGRVNAGQPLEYQPYEIDNIKNGVYTYFQPGGTTFLYLNQRDFTKDILSEQSIIQTYNVSARGGTEKMNYLFSVGYLDQDGYLKVGPDHFKRLNMRMNVGTELNKYIYLDSKVTYTNYVTNAPSGGNAPIGAIYKARLRNPIFNQAGSVEGGSDIGGIYGNLLYGGYNNRIVDDINSTFQATIKDLAKGLKFRLIYGHQIRSDDTEDFKRGFTLPNRNNIAQSVFNNPNSYNLNQGVQKTNNFQFLTNYDVTIAEDHKFAFLAGYQWDDYRASALSAGATNLASNEIPSLNLGDTTTRTNNQTIFTFANQSLFGSLDYSYKDKYLLGFTIRSDESSRLAPQSRTKTFPAVSAGWNMHKEEWFSKNLPFISEFRPRFSWGQLGNSLGIGYYDYLSMLGNGSALVLGNPETKTSYFFQNSVASSNLSWETVEEYNYALDFGFFQNKLTGKFDYYTKKNKNMLTPLTLPATFGVGSPKINNGVLESWGWEFEMNFRDKIGDDFNYSIGFNLSNNENKLKSYTGKTVVGIGTNTLIEGEPLNTIWGYKTQPGFINNQAELDAVKATAFYSANTGIGDVAYIDQNGDGKVNAGAGSVKDHGDLVKLGTDQQQYLFGVNGSANWKNLDFSFFIQGVGKRAFMPSTNLLEPFAASFLPPTSIHMDYWTPDHHDAAFPRPYYINAVNQNFATSDKWIMDGAYARLKNIQLGYSLPNSALKQGFFTRVRFYVSAENVATVSKLGIWKATLDPEQPNGAYDQYPLLGTTSLGVNLTF